MESSPPPPPPQSPPRELLIPSSVWVQKPYSQFGQREFQTNAANTRNDAEPKHRPCSNDAGGGGGGVTTFRGEWVRGRLAKKNFSMSITKFITQTQNTIQFHHNETKRYERITTRSRTELDRAEGRVRTQTAKMPNDATWEKVSS